MNSKIQEAMASVKRAAEFDSEVTHSNISHRIMDNHLAAGMPLTGVDSATVTIYTSWAEWQHTQDAALIEKLLQIIEKQHSALDMLAYANLHGCCTGDCPHANTSSCTAALIEELGTVTKESEKAIASSLEALKKLGER